MKRSPLLFLVGVLLHGFIVAAVAVCVPSDALAKEFQVLRRATGAVTGVADGDTLYMAIEGKRTRLRMAQIDAPEKRQAFGRRSEQSLRELVGHGAVTVTWREVDRYGRPIVQVVASGVDVNEEQVRRGFAWVYRKYSNDAALIAVESEARSARRGLWVDRQPIEPWVWRKQKRSP